MSDPFAVHDPRPVCVTHGRYLPCISAYRGDCESSVTWVDVAAVRHYQWYPGAQRRGWDHTRFQKLVS